jgi:hypothetical protein
MGSLDVCQCPHLLEDVADVVGVGELEDREVAIRTHGNRVDLDSLVELVPALHQQCLLSAKGGNVSIPHPFPWAAAALQGTTKFFPDIVRGVARAITNLLGLDFGLNHGQLEKCKTPHREGLVAAGLLLDLNLAVMDLHLCPEQMQ